ncbi:hypothetical protein HX037_01635 [Ignatzschineria indica]|uniref:hypothetical protein n=1 Tax=Ignatzschineria indica TaxID=472583 RepID=UPI00257768D9|nr:hypothetical protein [Ignatzschineria indica]MDM1544590.1 hypothetical protein [Ignatzschineria indica]
MEIVLIGLLALLIICYIVSLFLLTKEGVKKLWMSLFLLVYVVAVIALIMLHFKTGLLADIKDMSELYFAYSVITILLLLGLINIWVFKGVIIRVFRGKDLTFTDGSEKEKKK